MTSKDECKTHDMIVYLERVTCKRKITFQKRVVAIGSPGMFLCRDAHGFLWFETIDTLRKYYVPATCACGIFVLTKAEIHFPHQRFLLKVDNGPVFCGMPADKVVFYPSGACCVVRSCGKEKITMPIVLFGSIEEKKVKMIL